jgi:FkbH-like protein
MFEIEFADNVLDAKILPAEVREQFARPRQITHIGRITWEEHCTECSWPHCYSTCDLYNPRSDKNCRRSLEGFCPLIGLPVYGAAVVRMQFKRWVSLHGRCGLSLGPVEKVEREQARLHALSLAARRWQSLGGVLGKPALPSRVVHHLKRRGQSKALLSDAAPGAEPNCFVMEIYNPNKKPVSLSLDITPFGKKAETIHFKRLIQIESGFQRVAIPYCEIKQGLAEEKEAFINICPNLIDPEEEGLTLYFGLVNFARDPSLEPESVKSTPAKKVKVAVWDLDNTVWNGTLIEDGPGRVELRPGIRETVLELDRRGIVNSIASKNNEADALAELGRFGLREYFVFPAIGWGPKSDSIRQIKQAFNVGEDSIAFIDDQPFELEEVLARNPKVRVYRHNEVAGLLQREEFDVPVTVDAGKRRMFYKTEEVRQQALQESTVDYLEFLKQSGVRIVIEKAAASQVDRIHELVQRTNQMNFSGNRYSKSDLLAVLLDRQMECYFIDAQDRFGKYGYIGFAVVQPRAVPRVTDMAFSCRIQAKRVEHAVLIALSEKYEQDGASAIEVFYHATDRNAQVAQVFGDLGFTEASRYESNNFVYRLDLSRGRPEQNIVTVLWKDPGADWNRPRHEFEEREV